MSTELQKKKKILELLLLKKELIDNDEVVEKIVEALKGVDGRTPKEGEDYPSKYQLFEKVKESVSEWFNQNEQRVVELATPSIDYSLIKGEKGKDGKNGTNGTNGKDGSPDTPEQIIEKLMSIGGVPREVIKGLENIVDTETLNRAIEILDQRTKFLINKNSGNQSTSATLPAFTLPLISGGDRQFGIPGESFSSVVTSSMSPNDLIYTVFYTPYEVTISDVMYEITSVPGTSSANITVGVYATDENSQPTDLLFEVHDNPPNSTGVRTLAVNNVVLTPGTYLVAHNTDTAIQTRMWGSPTTAMSLDTPSSPFITHYRKSSTTYTEALNNPGLAFTSYVAAGTVARFRFLLRWT